MNKSKSFYIGLLFGSLGLLQSVGCGDSETTDGGKDAAPAKDAPVTQDAPATQDVQQPPTDAPVARILFHAYVNYAATGTKASHIQYLDDETLKVEDVTVPAGVKGLAAVNKFLFWYTDGIATANTVHSTAIGKDGKVDFTKLSSMPSAVVNPAVLISSPTAKAVFAAAALNAVAVPVDETTGKSTLAQGVAPTPVTRVNGDPIQHLSVSPDGKLLLAFGSGAVSALFYNDTANPPVLVPGSKHELQHANANTGVALSATRGVVVAGAAVQTITVTPGNQNPPVQVVALGGNAANPPASAAVKSIVRLSDTVALIGVDVDDKNLNAVTLTGDQAAVGATYHDSGVKRPVAMQIIEASGKKYLVVVGTAKTISVHTLDNTGKPTEVTKETLPEEPLGVAVAPQQ